ncbi:MAG: gephyrin-like molybdotransferase Glp [Gemmatimonadaceae bacterium]
MISVAEASARILDGIQRLPAEMVATEESVGRVLAERVVASTTSPPWDNSSMDGYAIRSADIGSETLRVVETIAAGSFASRALEAGEAMRIMTGAPVPENADTVIRKEDTNDGLDVVTIRDIRDSGKNVRKAGEDFCAGDVLFEAGQKIGIPLIGVLASAGVRNVVVYRSPRVAIVSSGDELVELNDYMPEMAGQKIVSANSITLAALVREAGGEPVNIGIARDDLASMKKKFEEAVGCDLIVTSAGISVGDHDHVRDAITELGGTIDFWKVRMRPGAPLAFGSLRGVPWIGLSGNPVSAIVTFEVFVRPVIRKMRGLTNLFRKTLSVTLGEPITLAASLMHFLRIVISQREDNSYVAHLAGSQSSAVLTAMARANALLVVPGDRLSHDTGERLIAIPMDTDRESVTTLVLS